MQKGLEKLALSEWKQNMKSKLTHSAFDKSTPYKPTMNTNRLKRREIQFLYPMVNPPIIYGCERTIVTDQAAFSPDAGKHKALVSSFLATQET